MESFQIILGGLGTLLSVGVMVGALYRFFIRPILAKNQKKVDAALEDAKSTAAWRTKTEGRLNTLEQSDSRIYDGVENVRLGLEQLRQENSDAHVRSNGNVQTEIRRLEEKMSSGRRDLFEHINKSRDEILHRIEVGGNFGKKS